jgi:ribosomal protein RSM22 (predicted rRNA methylase)
MYPKGIFPKLPKEKTHYREKFSYIICKKGVFEASDSSAAGRSFNWDRIVRRVMKRERHRIIDVCNVDGELERIINAKSHGDENGYKESKRLKIGDLWRFNRRVPNKYRKESKKGKRLW